MAMGGWHACHGNQRWVTFDLRPFLKGKFPKSPHNMHSTYAMLGHGEHYYKPKPLVEVNKYSELKDEVLK